MDVDGFCAELSAVLDGEGLVREEQKLAEYVTNLSGFSRRVPLVLRPSDQGQVEKIVAAANTYKVPLYPFSQGKNWGLGSKLPVADDCAMVNLRRMNAIVEINETFGYAILEPGVTQGQLAEHLQQKGSRFFLDVTGSGRETSIVGNTLERGVAYNSLRAEKLISLHVVLGNGTVLKTGFDHYENSRMANIHKFGVGPALDGLFPQSNFGIVTRATVELMPNPEHISTFLLTLKDEARLGEMVDVMRDLVQQGVLNAIVHIGNKRRGEITMTPLIYQRFKSIGQPVSREEAEAIVASQLKGPWSCIGNIMGSKSMAKAGGRIVKRRLAGFGQLRFMSPELLQFAKTATALCGVKKLNAFLHGSEELLNLNRGMPTNAAMHSAYWPIASDSPSAEQPDFSVGGMLFAAPIVPQDGDSVREVVAATDAVGEEHGFNIAVTLNIMHDKTLEGVISIDFDRNDSAACARALACIKALNGKYLELGFNPYRIDIESMPMLIDPQDSFWQTVQALKSVLDPNGIIAPKRYSLT